MIGYAIFSATLAFSLMCVSYHIMAQKYGWPIGAILAKEASIPKIMAIISAVEVLVKSYYLFSWWSPLLVLVISQFLGLVLTMTLKKHTQVVCIIGVFVGFIFSYLYDSESRPFGYLHTLFG